MNLLPRPEVARIPDRATFNPSITGKCCFELYLQRIFAQRLRHDRRHPARPRVQAIRRRQRRLREPRGVDPRTECLPQGHRHGASAGREGGSVVGLYLGWDMDLPVYAVSASLSLIWRVKSTSLHNSNHNQVYHNRPSTSPNTHLSECSTASTSTISTAMDSSPARRC